MRAIILLLLMKSVAAGQKQNREAMALASGPFITIGSLLGGKDGRNKPVLRRVHRTGDVVRAASPFASLRQPRWQPGSGQTGIVASVWHRGDNAGSLRTSVTPAIVVHDESSWSLFKPSGDASYCDSMHGPRCKDLLERFQAQPGLSEIVDFMAGQTETAWWSSGKYNVATALQGLVDATNRRWQSSAQEVQAAVSLGKMRQQTPDEHESHHISEYVNPSLAARLAQKSGKRRPVPANVSLLQRTALTRSGVPWMHQAPVCCLLVDHIQRHDCGPCKRFYAVPWLERVKVDGVVGHTTWRLQLDLIAKRAANVYTIFGDTRGPMLLPPKLWNERPPFGADLAGVHKAFHNISKSSIYDSWLTVGPTEGNPSGIGLGSAGIDFKKLSGSSYTALRDSAVFWMSPNHGPHSVNSSVTLAQLTLPTGIPWFARMNAQGREQHFGNEDTVDWVERNLTWAYLPGDELGAA